MTATAAFAVGITPGRTLPGGGRVEVETFGFGRATVRITGRLFRPDRHALTDVFTELALADIHHVAVDVVGARFADPAALAAVYRVRDFFTRGDRSCTIVGAAGMRLEDAS